MNTQAQSCLNERKVVEDHLEMSLIQKLGVESSLKDKTELNMEMLVSQNVL